MHALKKEAYLPFKVMFWWLFWFEYSETESKFLHFAIRITPYTKRPTFQRWILVIRTLFPDLFRHRIKRDLEETTYVCRKSLPHTSVGLVVGRSDRCRDREYPDESCELRSKTLRFASLLSHIWKSHNPVHLNEKWTYFRASFTHYFFVESFFVRTDRNCHVWCKF